MIVFLHSNNITILFHPCPYFTQMKRKFKITVLFTLLGLLSVFAKNSKERPNILFAIADDWSFGHAGAYGCKWIKTPAFDRLAKEGILFNRAYTPNAKCAPSRAIILTGRNSWQLEEAANHGSNGGVQN